MDKCLQCQNLTSNPKFCSRSCAAKYNNKLYPKRKLTRVCTQCPNQVTDYTSKLCTTCQLNRYKKYFTLRDLQNYITHKGRHKSWLYSIVRARCRKEHAERFKECYNCGYSLHIEMCHIKPITSFPLDTLITTVNSLNNVVGLCRNCHWELDHGHLSLDFPEFEEIHSNITIREPN